MDSSSWNSVVKPEALPKPSTVSCLVEACSVLTDSTYLPGEPAPQDFLLIDEEPFSFLGINVVISDFLKHYGTILWGEVPVDNGIVPHQVATFIKSHLLPHIVGKV